MALDPSTEDVLAQDDPALLDEQDDGPSEADYPEPEIGDVQLFLETVKPGFQALQAAIVEERSRRYQKKRLPAKLREHLQDGTHVFTRRTHNELGRVVGLQTDAPIQVEIQPAGDTDKARTAARAEQRWLSQVLPTLERVQPSGRPLRRRWVDLQNEDGLFALEVFLTGSYDAVIDTAPRPTIDPKTGAVREETEAEIQKRNDQKLIGKPLPFGVRVIDGMSLYFEEDGDEICRLAIVEHKPYRAVYSKEKRNAQKRARIAGVGNWRKTEPDIPANYPKAGTPGWSTGAIAMAGSQNTGAAVQGEDAGLWSSMPADGIETIRYYDPVWYAYIVGGRFVEGPVKHGQGRVPVFPGWGLTTSSPNIGEAAAGICSGMGSIETAMDWTLTNLNDLHFTYNRPKWFVEQPDVQGKVIPTSATDSRPAVLDFSQPGVIQGAPGQHIVNALQGWEPFAQLAPQYLTVLDSYWQKNGLNPAAQGEAPSGSSSGYQLNLMSTSAQSPYHDCLVNEATTWGRVLDHIRHLIRDVLKEKVPLTVPGEGKKKGTSEWLYLGPEDITDSPAVCKIDGTNEANKAQKAQYLSQGNKEGYISRARVQMEGYGVEDVDAEDDQIALDIADQQMVAWDIQQAQMRILNGGMAPQAGAPPPGDPNAPPTAGAPPPVGPPAPPIGAQMAAASQAPAGTPPGTVASMRAGQGARPPIRPGASPQ